MYCFDTTKTFLCKSCILQSVKTVKYRSILTRKLFKKIKYCNQTVKRTSTKSKHSCTGNAILVVFFRRHWHLYHNLNFFQYSFNIVYLKDRAHLSTFKIFIFEKYSCFIVLVFFLVIVQSSELVSLWFWEKMTFFLIFLVTTYLRYMWAGLPWGCRPLAG